MLISRLGSGRTSPAFFQIDQEERHDVGFCPQMFWRLLGNPSIEMLNGKDAGPVEDTTLRSIGHYALSLGRVKSPKFPIFLEYNPELLQYGQVSLGTTLLLPGEETDLIVLLSTFKQVPLGDIKWIVKAGISRVP
jgi:hypothetical protein